MGLAGHCRGEKLVVNGLVVSDEIPATSYKLRDSLMLIVYSEKFIRFIKFPEAS